MLNLLVHREYSFSASAFISIYTDRIGFVSIGGLMPGIELRDVMVGISICRNQDLANVFYRLHLIEVYGPGMGKIMKVYEGMQENLRLKPLKMPLILYCPILTQSTKHTLYYYKINNDTRQPIGEIQSVVFN